MSGDVVPVRAPAVQPSEEMSVGERLRSTMAAEYAAPFLTELNRMQAVADAAVDERDRARRTSERLAKEIAAEHARRLTAERQVDEEREKVRRTIAVFSAPRRPRRTHAERARFAWAILRGRA